MSFEDYIFEDPCESMDRARDDGDFYYCSNYETPVGYPRKKCKFCGEDDLHWEITEEGFRLFDDNDEIHCCLLKTESHPTFKDETKQEVNLMQQNHLVELLLENFYTIGVSFHNSSKVYTYKVAKDIELEVNDSVIVETNTGFEIVNVERVDEGMNIDLTLNVKYKFIVQKIDFTQYIALTDKDTKVAQMLAHAATQNAKKELMKQYIGALSDDQIKLLEEECGAEMRERL